MDVPDRRPHRPRMRRAAWSRVRYWAAARAAAGGPARTGSRSTGPLTLAEVVRRCWRLHPGTRLAARCWRSARCWSATGPCGTRDPARRSCVAPGRHGRVPAAVRRRLTPEPAGNLAGARRCSAVVTHRGLGRARAPSWRRLGFGLYRGCGRRPVPRHPPDPGQCARRPATPGRGHRPERGPNALAGTAVRRGRWGSGPRSCSSPQRLLRARAAPPARCWPTVAGQVPTGSPTSRSTPRSTSSWSAGSASCARRPPWCSTGPGAERHARGQRRAAPRSRSLAALGSSGGLAMRMQRRHIA